MALGETPPCEAPSAEAEALIASTQLLADFNPIFHSQIVIKSYVSIKSFSMICN